MCLLVSTAAQGNQQDTDVDMYMDTTCFPSHNFKLSLGIPATGVFCTEIFWLTQRLVTGFKTVDEKKALEFLHSRAKGLFIRFCIK